MYGRNTQATFMLDGKRVAYSYLAVGYGDGFIRVFDIHKAEVTLKVQPHKSAVTNLIYGNGKCPYIAFTWGLC